MPPPGASVNVMMALQAAYARQCHLIDSGHAAEWAATFTPDGLFDSPTYPDPVRGTAALTEFARRFAELQDAERIRHRHVLTNIDVVDATADRISARAYLQIVETRIGGSSRIARMTIVSDELHRTQDAWWLVARRIVKRDDAQ